MAPPKDPGLDIKIDCAYLDYLCRSPLYTHEAWVSFLPFVGSATSVHLKALRKSNAGMFKNYTLCADIIDFRHLVASVLRARLAHEDLVGEEEEAAQAVSLMQGPSMFVNDPHTTQPTVQALPASLRSAGPMPTKDRLHEVLVSLFEQQKSRKRSHE